MLLVSNRTSCYEEAGVIVVAFEAIPEESGGESHLILQRSLLSSEEDKRLGMDVVHLEVSDQRRGGYGLMEKAELRHDRLRIVLNREGRATIGAVEVEVRFASEDRPRLATALRAVLRGVEFHCAPVASDFGAGA